MKKFLLILIISIITINIFAEKTCKYTYQSNMGKFDPETNLIIELIYQIDQCDVISGKDINKLILESQKQILEVFSPVECVVGKGGVESDIEYLTNEKIKEVYKKELNFKILKMRYKFE